MPTKKLSVNEFWKITRQEIRKIADDHDWNIDKAQDRGFAFQLWVANVIATAEQTLETDPEDAMLFTKDLKADLVFEDPNLSHFVICQCKYEAKGSPVDETEVNDFFHRHNHYMDSDWVRSHGSTDAVDALIDYADRIRDGWSVSYYFISTGKASTRVGDLAAACNDEFSELGLRVTCDLLDFSKFKEYYARSLSLELSVPKTVTLDLPKGQYFEKTGPHPTVVAVLRGNALRNLSKQYKQSLYAWNIRGYLGNRGINKSIGETAAEEPDLFFYFNNGVSAICTGFEFDGNELTAHDFQIINGAQTVSTLGNNPANSDIEVLFRLTKTEDVKTEKGMNRKIIQFNNSQNVVKVSDFRSNDEIQVFLERILKEKKARGPVPRLKYLRKRSVGRKGVGQGIKLEEMAKVRYAYLFEPTLVHSAPKSLWTPAEDGGVYEKAFGVDGELESAWSDRTLNQALLAATLFFRVVEETKILARKNPDNRYLGRLKFHALALAGLHIRTTFDSDSDWESLVRNKAAFEKYWDSFWPIAKGVLIDLYDQAEADGSTLFAFVRSSERWEAMQNRFQRHIAAR